MCKIPQKWHLLLNCIYNKDIRTCSSNLSHYFALPASTPVAHCTNSPASQTRMCVSSGGPGHHPTPTRATASPVAMQLFVQLCEEPYWGTGSNAYLFCLQRDVWQWNGEDWESTNGASETWGRTSWTWLNGFTRCFTGNWWRWSQNSPSWPQSPHPYLSIHGRYAQSFLFRVCFLTHSPKS